MNFNTRHRVNNNPSRLDLIFTNEEEMIDNITSEAPVGLSDHVGISFELVLSTNIIRQSHEANTLNFGKSDIEQMNVVFKTINWTDI